MGLLSNIFGKGKDKKKQETPKQTYQEWEREKVEEYTQNNQTWGETWKKIASNELGAMTLVNGKNTHEVLEDPEAKNDLGLMLACCKAELERADIGEPLVLKTRAACS